MSTATMTSKGQMTLPKDVRDDLGLKPGDQVEIVKQNGGYVLIPRNIPASALAGMLGKSPQGAMSLAQEDDALAQALAEEDERIRAGR